MKSDDPEQEQAPVAEEVAEPPAEQQEAAEREQVRVHDPRQRRLGEAEVLADRRQRHATIVTSRTIIRSPRQSTSSASQRVRLSRVMSVGVLSRSVAIRLDWFDRATQQNSSFPRR